MEQAKRLSCASESSGKMRHFPEEHSKRHAGHEGHLVVVATRKQAAVLQHWVQVVASSVRPLLVWEVRAAVIVTIDQRHGPVEKPAIMRLRSCKMEQQVVHESLTKQVRYIKTKDTGQRG